MSSQQRLLDVIRRHNEEVDELCKDWKRNKEEEEQAVEGHKEMVKKWKGGKKDD